MIEPTIEELIQDIKKELVRVYGRQYAEKCLLEHGFRWVSFSRPKKTAQGKYVMDPITQPMRRNDLLALLEQLRAQKSFRRFGLF